MPRSEPLLGDDERPRKRTHPARKLAPLLAGTALLACACTVLKAWLPRAVQIPSWAVAAISTLEEGGWKAPPHAKRCDWVVAQTEAADA